ncbi:hypothetical protein D3C71_1750720 [compost metagenome]
MELVAKLKRIREPVAVDRIAIGLSLGRPAGMEGERYFIGFRDDNILRQTGIQSEAPAFQGDLRSCFEVKGLPVSMYARIRPPRSGNLHSLPCQMGNRLLQQILNCISFRLRLKTEVMSTVISHFHEQVAHPALLPQPTSPNIYSPKSDA